MRGGTGPGAATLAFAADTPPGLAGTLCASMARAVEAIEPGCTSWVEAYVARLKAARVFLEGLGIRPEINDRRQIVPMWRVPMFTGLFSDAEVIELARGRGFDG